MRRDEAWFTEPLTGKRYRQELRAATRSQFRPIERQLAAETRASQHRIGREIPAWFDQYRQALAQSQAQTAAAFQQAGQQIQGQLQTAGTADAAQQQQLLQQQQQLAGVRGMAPAQTPDAAHAAARRQEIGATFGGTLATQGAAQQGFQANQAAIAQGEAANQRIAELRRLRGIAQDKRELKREKGDFRTQFRQQQRQTEREYQMQQLALAMDALAARNDQGYNEAIQNVAQLGLQGRLARAATDERIQRSRARSERRDRRTYGKQGKGGKDRSGSTDRGYAGAHLRERLGELGKKQDPYRWLKNHRTQMIDKLVASDGVNRRTARQVVERYLRKNRPKGGGRTPGERSVGLTYPQLPSAQ